MKRLIHTLWIGVLVICLLGLPASAQAKPFAYIPCGTDQQVSVINTATNTVVDTVPVEQYHLFGVAVHPDGTYVYVTGDDGVAVIDRQKCYCG